MSEGDRWRLGHRPELDGIRGVAILLVMASHVEAPYLGAGGLFGVTAFFTLSGFLIATLLFEQLETSRRVRFAQFYVRRARRLLPALFAVVAVTVLLTWATGIRFASGLEVLGALTYSSNIIGVVAPPEPGGMLHHTWSLVLEEQFYLVWPATALLMWRRPRLLAAVLVGGIAFSMVQRVRLVEGLDTERVMFGMDTRMDGILVGCLLALAARSRVPAVPRSAVVGAMVLLGSVAVLWPRSAWFALGISLAGLVTMVVIGGVLAGTAPAWLRWRWLTLIGRRSYGLYLWHHVVLVLVMETLAIQTWLELALAVVPASVVLTALSWRFIEKPFLRPAAAEAGSAAAAEAGSAAAAEAGSAAAAEAESAAAAEAARPPAVTLRPVDLLVERPLG